MDKKYENKLKGFFLRGIRKENKLTQKKFGELIGKSEITIRKYESGEINIPFDIWYIAKKKLKLNKTMFIEIIDKMLLEIKKNNYIKDDKTVYVCIGDFINNFIDEIFPPSINFSFSIQPNNFFNEEEKKEYVEELTEIVKDSIYIYITRILDLNVEDAKVKEEKRKKILEIEEQTIKFLNFLLYDNQIKKK